MFILAQNNASDAVRLCSALCDYTTEQFLKTDEKLMINDGFLSGFPEKSLIQEAP